MVRNPTLPDFSVLFDTAPCALVVTDEDGLIRLANATFCTWTGFEADTLVGQQRWQALLTVGGRIFHQTHMAPLLRMQGAFSEVAFDMVRRDGEIVPLLVNAVRRETPQGVHHELAFFVAKDRNRYERQLLESRKRAEASLTAQKLSQQQLALAEARLRLALSSGALYVWDFDPRADERRYDDGVALLLGHAAARPTTAQEFLSAMPAQDRDAEALALQDAASHGRDAFQVVVRLNGVDGLQRVVSVSAIGIREGTCPPQVYVGVLQDITEHSRERAMAEHRATFAEQMVAIASHDLRNPLSTIKMAAAMLARDNVSLRQTRLLGYIDDATERSKRLIADLLDFTLVRVGQGLRVTRKPIDWHGSVKHGLSELELAFPGRHLVHRTEGIGSGDADLDRIIQVLGNLVANAAVYGAADTPIVITTMVDHACMVLSVHNHGTPIAEQLLMTMFEPMTRGEDQGTRSVGLGLFIVRAIAQAHAGAVNVVSTAQDGTTFTVRIPR